MAQDTQDTPPPAPAKKLAPGQIPYYKVPDDYGDAISRSTTRLEWTDEPSTTSPSLIPTRPPTAHSLKLPQGEDTYLGETFKDDTPKSFRDWDSQNRAAVQEEQRKLLRSLRDGTDYDGSELPLKILRNMFSGAVQGQSAHGDPFADKERRQRGDLDIIPKRPARPR